MLLFKETPKDDIHSLISALNNDSRLTSRSFFVGPPLPSNVPNTNTTSVVAGNSAAGLDGSVQVSYTRLTISTLVSTVAHKALVEVPFQAGETYRLTDILPSIIKALGIGFTASGELPDLQNRSYVAGVKGAVSTINIGPPPTVGSTRLLPGDLTIRVKFSGKPVGGFVDAPNMAVYPKTNVIVSDDKKTTVHVGEKTKAMTALYMVDFSRWLSMSALETTAIWRAVYNRAPVPALVGCCFFLSPLALLEINEVLAARGLPAIDADTPLGTSIYNYTHTWSYNQPVFYGRAIGENAGSGKSTLRQYMKFGKLFSAGGGLQEAVAPYDPGNTVDLNYNGVDERAVRLHFNY